MRDATRTNALRPVGSIRAVVAADLVGLRGGGRRYGAVASAMLDDMLASYFAGSDDETWLTTVDEGPEAGPVAVAYVAPSA